MKTSLNILIKMTFSFLMVGVNSYAQKNIECINIEQIDVEVWNFLSDDITNSKIVLIGETHDVKPNSTIQNSFFIYLNKYHGIKNMLLESGYSHAYLYNKYIETGDEKYLNAIVPKSKKFSSHSIAIWKELFIYNSKLPKSRKIKTIGIDFEREPSLSSSLLLLLEPDTLNLYSKDLFKKIASRADTIGFVSDNKAYVEWLRIEFEKLEFEILSNSETIASIIYNNSFYTNFYDRDYHMVQNFKKYSSKGESYFGQFGTMHTQLNNKEVFAGQLNNSDYYKNEILTINLHYENYKYVYNKKVKYSFLNDLGFFRRSVIRKNKYFFGAISNCENFIYKIESKNKNLDALRNKCQYVIYMNGKDI